MINITLIQKNLKVKTSGCFQEKPKRHIFMGTETWRKGSEHVRFLQALPEVRLQL